MPSKLHMKRGFTLVEAIVALGVLVAIIALIMPGIARFLTMTRADFLNMCLWESAMSEFNRVKANPDAVGRTNTYTCGAIVVNTLFFGKWEHTSNTTSVRVWKQCMCHSKGRGYSSRKECGDEGSSMQVLLGREP